VSRLKLLLQGYPSSLRVSNFIQIFIAVERRLVRIKPLPQGDRIFNPTPHGTLLRICSKLLMAHSSGTGRTEGRVMATKRRPSFDPKSFLAKVGEGRSIEEYHKDEIVMSQGDPADAVFYIQSGKVKVTSFRSKARKQSSQFLERTNSSVKDVLPGRRSA
jgi:CRP-like cAMP-binding protein